MAILEEHQFAAVRAPKSGHRAGVTWTSPSITTNVATDVLPCAGYRYGTILVNNGATNSVIFLVQGSLDGTNFSDLAWQIDYATATTAVKTARTTTAGTKELLFITGSPLLTHIRVSVSTANANGTTFKFFMGVT